MTIPAQLKRDLVNSERLAFRTSHLMHLTPDPSWEDLVGVWPLRGETQKAVAELYRNSEREIGVAVEWMQARGGAAFNIGEVAISCSGPQSADTRTANVAVVV